MFDFRVFMNFAHSIIVTAIITFAFANPLWSGITYHTIAYIYKRQLTYLQNSEFKNWLFEQLPLELGSINSFEVTSIKTQPLNAGSLMFHSIGVNSA